MARLSIKFSFYTFCIVYYTNSIWNKKLCFCTLDTNFTRTVNFFMALLKKYPTIPCSLYECDSPDKCSYFHLDQTRTEGRSSSPYEFINALR